MVIGFTCSVANSLRRVKKRRCARTVRAKATSSPFLAARSGIDSRRLAKVDIDYRQSRLMTVMSAYYLNLDIGAVSGADRNGLGQLPVGECFLRRSDSQGAVWPMAVIPIRKVIQPALDGRGAHSQQREPLPLLEAFEESLIRPFKNGARTLLRTCRMRCRRIAFLNCFLNCDPLSVMMNFGLPCLAAVPRTSAAILRAHGVLA